MSRKAVLGAIGVCVLLGVIGISAMAWFWFTRDRAAVATYRVEIPLGQSISEVVENEENMLKSDDVLIPVIAELDLLERWNFSTDAEALMRLRSKLKVKESALGDYVKVVYRDRSQERALEILDAINLQFAAARREAASVGKLPRIRSPQEP